MRNIFLTGLLAFLLALLVACGGAGSSPQNNNAPEALNLAWLPHPDETVAGYIVYYGPNIDTVTQVASNLSVGSPNFNPQAPAVQYNAEIDLRLQPGDTVCFRLKAYNVDGLSDYSPGVCTLIPGT